MAGRRVSRLFTVVREPWTLLATGFGGGVVWAAGGPIALAATGLDFVTALSATFSAIGNIGPGLGAPARTRPAYPSSPNPHTSRRPGSGSGQRSRPRYT